MSFEVFDGNSLKDMLLEAIRYGDQPEVRARLRQKIDNALDRENLLSILNRDALARSGEHEPRTSLCCKGGNGKSRGTPPPAILRVPFL